MKYFEEMEDLKEALEVAEDKGDRAGEARALYGIGRIYFREKVLDAAEEYWGRCRAVCREAGLEREFAQVMIDLGDLAAVNEKASGAMAAYREALEAYRRIDEIPGVARSLERLGGVEREQGRPEQALALMEEGLNLCRRHEDRIGALFFLEQIIPIFKGLGRVEDVERSYRESVTLAEKLGDRDRMAMGLVGLADIRTRTRRPGEAIPYLSLAHDHYLRLGKEKEAGFIRSEIERIEREIAADRGVKS